jgi:ribosomal protein L37AE/L43A
MSENVVRRERVREGVVECPLCGRQIAAPADHLVVYSTVESADVDTADAIECPACTGVTFVVDRSDAE